MVPFAIPLRLLRLVLLHMPLHPLAARLLLGHRRVRSTKRWLLVHNRKPGLELVRDYRNRPRSVLRIELK